VIGVFDSGFGGLSVWREIDRLMPDEPIVYLADQARVPYGSRSLREVRDLTAGAADWLLERGCDVVVLACNTASAAALRPLRALHPDRQFVGMEPAVKPAASLTRTGTIGVLATQATFQGELFAEVVARFAAGVRVLRQPCAGWVELVEAGCAPAADEPACAREARARVADCILPLLDAGADALVLGCTHFPFLIPYLEAAVADWRAARGSDRRVEIIDPGPAVARQARRVRLALPGRPCGGQAAAREFWTTGDAERFDALARRLAPELGRAQARRLDPDRLEAAAGARSPALSHL
jgi:glutamate racemase